jgi:hypothetical protein
VSVADRGFLHDDGEFGDALAIVATQRGVGEALVEKDYWITHTLWALVEAGLTVSFKGGTSLSKGFGLIRRFSEDLDVKIESPGLPAVPDWVSTSKTAGLARRAYFVALGERLQVPGARVEEDPALRDEAWRSATFKVTYPKRSAGALPAVMRPYVQLEVGSARITPGEPRPLTSWLHELVEEQGRLGIDFIANLPGDVHCVSPHVTLLEKIEAITRRFAREPLDPPTFVRHFEDVYHILDSLSRQDMDRIRQLRLDMFAAGELRRPTGPEDVAWAYDGAVEVWARIERAWEETSGLFWGERVAVRDCVSSIRSFLTSLG